MSILPLLRTICLSCCCVCWLTSCEDRPPAIEPAPVTVNTPPPSLPLTTTQPLGEEEPMAFAAEASRNFSDYFTHYRQYFPDMMVDDFVLTDSMYANEFYQYDAPVDLVAWEPVFGDYSVGSPNGQYWLDVHSYEVEKMPNGEWMAGSADSEAALIATSTGRRIRLLFCGSACSFADGFWMDGDTIIIAGLAANTGRHQPTLWRINLDSRRIETYTYPQELREGQRAYSALQ